jgi:hypothetical protein
MGALVYNFGSFGGGMDLQVYSTLSANASLVQDIVNSWPTVIQYFGLLTNQTGPSTAKGMINGVRSDAFPAPPLLDLSDIGGTESPMSCRRRRAPRLASARRTTPSASWDRRGAGAM